MLDIALIRERPHWVKEQIGKLFDDEAPARIDKILELDARRREIRTRVETAQAARNRLNRAMGKLRGNRRIDENSKADLAVAATASMQLNEVTEALAILEGEITIDKTMAKAFRQPLLDLSRS